MNLAARLRTRRVEGRSRRALSRALESAATPTMRHELIVLAQQQLPHMR